MALVGSGNSLGGIAGSNAVARLLVVISGNSAGLDAAIAQANGSIAGLGASASSIGKTLTRTATLPLLAIGGAAVKMAIDFESAIARLAGLTPIVDDFEGGINEVRQSILNIANDPQVVAAPTEIADALYYAGSAGLDGAKALDVVKLAAQGASVGLGQAADISKVLIFALNNYESSGLTAASAMDALTAAVREGTAAPEEMAVALGRLLPVAQEAGVTFNQVVGSVAQLSNLGVPTRVATTSLRALFGQLLSPTIQATELLNELGVSAEELRGAFQNGPIAAFELLEGATHGNIDALHDIIPQIRAFTAYLGLSGDKADELQGIFKEVNESTGDFQHALDIMSQTPEFKFQKALQELKLAAIDFGQNLIPAFNQLSQILGDIGKILGSLPEGLQTFLGGMLLIGAAAGPLLQLYGALIKTKEIMTTVNGITSAETVPTWGAVARGFTVAAIAGVLAYGAFKSIADGSTSLVTAGVAVVGTLVAVTLAMKGLGAAGVALAPKIGVTASNALVALGEAAVPIAAGVTLIGLAIASSIREAGKMGRAVDQMGESLLAGAKTGDALKTSLAGVADDDIRVRITAIAKSMGLLGQATGDALVPLKQGIGESLVTNMTQLRGAMDDVGAGIDPMLGDQLAAYVPTIESAVAAGRDLGPALEAAGLDASDLNRILAQSVNESGTVAIRDQAKAVQELMLSYPETIQQIRAFDEAQKTSIALQVAGEQAVEDYAKAHGVSAEFVQAALDKYGVSFATMSDEAQKDFEAAAFSVDGFAGVVDAKAAEIDAAVTEAAHNMSEAMAGSITLFDAFPEKVKKSASAISQHAEAVSNLMLQQTKDVFALSNRGVPQGLIDQLLAQGPEMVGKFADASEGELRRLVSAYQVNLAAMDEEILKEAAHQEKKGSGMVEGMALAILGSSQLTKGAATTLIQQITAEFNKGNLNGAALKMIGQFTKGLSSMPGVSKGLAARAIHGFAQTLSAGQGVNKAGEIVVSKFAQALSQRIGVPVAVARRMIERVTGQIDEGANRDVLPSGKVLMDNFSKGMQQKEGEVASTSKGIARKGAAGMAGQAGPYRTAGADLGAAFAHGLASSSGLAEAAARAVAANAKAAFDHALHNSPEYFTYYMGRKLMDDMGRGLKDGNRALQAYRPSVTIGVKDDRRAQEDSMSRAIAKGIRDGQGDTIVQIDGREVVRAGRHQHMRRHG